MGISSFTQFDVWKLAHQATLDVYRLTRDFPSEEKFGLVAQMRKSAISIAANIAEGFGRRHARDKMRFYNISEGSLQELRYYFILARDLGYVADLEQLLGLIRDVESMLRRLIAAIGRGF